MRIALATAFALCLATPALANDDATHFLVEAAAAEEAAAAAAESPVTASAGTPAAVPFDDAATTTVHSFFLADAAARAEAEAQTASTAATEVTAAPAGSGSVHALVTEAALRHGIDPSLAHAVATVESRYRCSAVGRAGELGVMQVKPATARSVGVTGNLRDCATGIEAGVRYLKQALARHGDGCGGISAYNMGIHRKASFCNGYGRKVMAQMSRIRVASVD